MRPFTATIILIVFLHVKPTRSAKTIHWCADLTVLAFALRQVLSVLIGEPQPFLASACTFVISMFVGFSYPKASVFALAVLCLPCNALLQMGIGTSSLSPSFLFSSLAMGWIAAGHCRRKGLSRHAGGQPTYRHLPGIIAAISTIWIFISCGVQVSEHWDSIEWRVLVQTPLFGFGHEYYFVTASFILISGLEIFRRIFLLQASRIVMVIPIWGLAICLFCFLQYTLNIPEPLWGVGFFLPLEDISSFGSFLAVTFTYLCWSLTLPHRWTFATRTIIGTLLSALSVCAVLSFSRATWLTITLSAIALAFYHLSRRGVLILTFALLCALGMFQLRGISYLLESNAYLSRFSALVRIEDVLSKDGGRTHLYFKAARMIAERPLTGHGVGSFYRSSMRYRGGGVSDPYKDQPEFAHNSLLQLTAELGIPAAALSLLLILCACQPVLQQRGGHCSIALFAALWAYITTQMTANSLNVYITNQIAFSVLLGALSVNARYATPNRQS